MSIAPMKWWLNRKSKLGLQPSARMPPHLPGKEWWTDPPTTVPQPEHIEFVIQFQQQLHTMPGSDMRNRLQQACKTWLGAARRLLHEEAASPNRADLHTTDGLMIAASSALQKMRSLIYGLGGSVTDDVAEIMDAVQGRAGKLRRERAIESSKRVSIHPTLYRAEPVHVPTPPTAKRSTGR